MAKIKSAYLAKKYGETNISHGNYQTLMTEVLANNTSAISNALARQSAQNWAKGLDKITTKEKRFVLPNLQDVLPKRSIYINKSVEKSKLITDTLKDRLTKNLRNTLENFTTTTGKPAFVRQAGKLAGTINPEVITQFQNSIKTTFESYTKKDQKYGIPANIHNIAVTEVRSTVNYMKYQYMKELIHKNEKILKVMKRWRQNKSLAKVPRRTHSEANGQTVEFNQPFELNHYRKVNGIERFSRKIYCRYPHDQTLPLNQLIGCNCDFEIIAQRI